MCSPLSMPGIAYSASRAEANDSMQRQMNDEENPDDDVPDTPNREEEPDFANVAAAAAAAEAENVLCADPCEDTICIKRRRLGGDAGDICSGDAADKSHTRVDTSHKSRQAKDCTGDESKASARAKQNQAIDEAIPAIFGSGGGDGSQQSCCGMASGVDEAGGCVETETDTGRTL